MKKIFSRLYIALLAMTAVFDLSVISYLGYVFYTIKTGAIVFSPYGIPLSIALIAVNSASFLISFVYFILKKIR